MTLAPTLRSPRAPHWRRPGGPWDIGTLDAVLGAGGPVVDGDVRLAPADVEARVAALAGALRVRGVRRRDVVAWQLANCHEAILLYRACWRLGAVAAPVHHGSGAADVHAALAGVQPKMFVASRDEVAALLDDPAGGAVAPAEGAARPSDLAAVIFTAGSTGAPKAVLHTHRTLAYKARLMVGVHGLHRHDAVLMPAPLAHVSGLLNGLLVPAAAGMTSVLQAKWDAEHALRLVAAERVSFMVGPPTFFLGLMDADGFAPEEVASLRLVSSGGAGVTPAFVERATAELGAVVKRTYGSSETPTITTTFPDDPPERAVHTDGRRVGDVELRLSPAGELLVRGPEMFVGYADAAQTTAACARGGWFRTGDLATIDGDGWLTIVGRLKDVIIRGGENIATAEVEGVLEAHPAVRHAVAVGAPDHRLGERVVAYVVADRSFDLDDCRAWFEARGVTRFKWPEAVVTVDRLPLLPTGKPDRAALRIRAAGPVETAGVGGVAGR